MRYLSVVDYYYTTHFASIVASLAWHESTLVFVFLGEVWDTYETHMRQKNILSEI